MLCLPVVVHSSHSLIPYILLLTLSAGPSECLTLQSVEPQTCCEPDTGNFCQIQCNNGLCRCVDPLTGVQIGDLTFPENDESIDCSLSKCYV